jgi:exopolysaccharide biosynthesis polyprenyl glycosylphosphotransferase
MDEFSVITLRKEPLKNIDNRFKKRVFDIIFSSFVIVFVLSWLYPILAIIIKLQSPGPVLFKQLRSGRDNVPFWCFKFRSMKCNDASDKRQATRDDDRVTKIGKFMRRTSLDELPQFFNVLLGDMSVMGPRPHMLNHTEQYRAIIDKYMVRQFLKPGISGWAQVNGYRGETKDPILMEKRVQHDIWYMENWSVMLDIKILFMTIINMLKGEENAF